MQDSVSDLLFQYTYIGVKLLTQNTIYGNKHALSCDICYLFSAIEQLCYICEGGYFSQIKGTILVTLKIIK